MDNDLDIQISPMFAENLSSRIANIKVSRGIGYRSNLFYSIVIILLMALNLAIGLVSLKSQKSGNNGSDNQTSVLASEYGIGQSSNLTF